MQTLIATLDAGLHASLVALLAVLQPGAQARRVYNAPEINALLEGEAVSLAFIDANLIGDGDQFSAQDFASRYPQTRFFVLGGDVALQLNSAAPLPRPPMDAAVPPIAASIPEPLAEDGPALTGRQADVLRLVREGKATKEIARHLGLAVPTVKTHLAALYRQLGVRNRVEAAMKQTVAPPSAVVRPFPTQRLADPAAITRALGAMNGLRAVG